MAITGRTAKECFDRFGDHVGPLITKLITSRYPLRFERSPQHKDLRILRFANPADRHAVPVDSSKYGRLYLYIAQELQARQGDAGEYRLHTLKYWYKIFDRSPALRDGDAVIRWEYAAQSTPSTDYSRHHMQFGKMVPEVPIGDAGATFSLTHLHMPTGWVLMEEVFRFLIVDLKVTPLCGDDWPRILSESEDTFYTGFTSRGGRGTLPPKT